MTKRNDFKIIDFKPEFSEAFKVLNLEWLETYFYVEDYDMEVLSNPETYIINKGGHIFFILNDDEVAGTVALMRVNSKAFELTKMAVNPNFRGKKLGQQLMQHCLDEAKRMSLDKLILYSNTKLENAIYIYRKFGFVEVAQEPNVPYERSNIKMEYKL